jgi:hypothetical protein
MPLTSRERVLASVNHQEPDQVAVDFGGTTCTSMSVAVADQLRESFGLEKKPIEVMDVYTMAAMVDSELQGKLGSDVTLTLPRATSHGFHRDRQKSWVTPWGQEVLVPSDFVCREDGAGGLYTYPQGDLSAQPSGHMPKDGFYFDAMIRAPRIESKKDLDLEGNLEEFALFGDEDLAYIKRAVVEAYDTGRAVSFTMPGTGLGDIADVPGVGLKRPRGIRTIEDWYMAPLRFPQYVSDLFERQVDVALENFQALHQAVGGKIQHLMLCGTDLGHQTSLFFSPKVFKTVYLRHYQKMIGWIHQNTPWKVGKHSCGAIVPLIPLLIESGFDTLNPVQCSATGMDPKFLKKEFGGHITFWGGGVDTQQVLPFGTPAEVRAQTLERCEIFAPGGGFVFNTIHNIQSNVPIPNIIAMVDAVAEFNGQKPAER